MSVGSLVGELTTDVNSTVEHLRELGAHMRDDAHGFSPEDLKNIDEVTTALRDLDAKRLKAHELLEAETIKASVLRHRLAAFPHKLRAELSAALGSARESNAAQIQDLQSKLSEISEGGSQAERKQEVLELHNEVLQTEQKKLKTKHEELVKKVNAMMLKKAKMQIELNETMDKLTDTTTKIGSLEDGMQRLLEEMKSEKEHFAAEKQSLSDLMNTTRMKHRKQLEENRKLNKELEVLQGEVVESKLTMDGKQKALEEVEANIVRLLGLEEELRGKLKNGAQRTAELEKIKADILARTEQTRKDYAAKKKEVLEKTQQYKREVELTAAETQRLAGIKRGLKRDLKRAQGAGDMQAQSLAAIQENVSTSKHTLLFQAEESARLEKENRELEFKLGQLRETHKVNVQLYKEEIGELRDKLNKEKKTRLIVEESCSDLQSQIEAHQVQYTKTMATLTAKMDDARKQHEQMSDKSVELQSHIEEMERTITSLNQQLMSAQSKLHSLKTSLEEQIQTLEQNIADLSEELCDQTETLQQIEPTCQSLQEEFDQRNAHYESRKKEVIGLKNKRASLDEQIQRTQRDLEKMHVPQDKLRMETLRCRAYTRQHLREQGREVEEVERRVLDARQQLTAINRENERIEEACGRLEQETARLKALFEGRGDMEAELEAQLRTCRGSLEEQWRENEKLEKSCSARDRVVLKDITALREASEGRLQTISAIHDQFDQELQAFSNFINRAAGEEHKRKEPS